MNHRGVSGQSIVLCIKKFGSKKEVYNVFLCIPIILYDIVSFKYLEYSGLLFGILKSILLHILFSKTYRHLNT